MYDPEHLVQTLAFMIALTNPNLKVATVSWGHSWHRSTLICRADVPPCPWLIVQVRVELSFLCSGHRGTRGSEQLQQ